MAIFKSGIQGRPTGKMGRMVFYMLNGQSVARSIGKSDKISNLQRANHQAMSVTMKCLKHMVAFINEGFGLKAAGTTKNPFNLATSRTKKEALTGTYPHLSIDYSKIVLSQGTVAAPQQTTLTQTKTGVEVTWDAYYDQTCEKDDMVMIMLYLSAESGRQAINHLYAARRSEGKCFIPLSPRHIDQPTEAYMFFKANNGKAVSDSVYLGNLNGAEESIAEKEDKITHAKVKKRFEVVESNYLSLMNHPDGPPPESKKLSILRTEYKALQKQLAALEERPGFSGVKTRLQVLLN